MPTISGLAATERVPVSERSAASLDSRLREGDSKPTPRSFGRVKAGAPKLASIYPKHGEGVVDAAGNGRCAGRHRGSMRTGPESARHVISCPRGRADLADASGTSATAAPAPHCEALPQLDDLEKLGVTRRP